MACVPLLPAFAVSGLSATHLMTQGILVLLLPLLSNLGHPRGLVCQGLPGGRRVGLSPNLLFSGFVQ